MKERGILFSAPMVLALLAGTKTQTRRTTKPQPPAETVSFCTYHHPDPRVHHWAFDGGSLLDFAMPCPYGEPGDRLWVRETCRAEELPDGQDGVRYLADNAFRPIADTPEAAAQWSRLNSYRGLKGATVPGIHMPRWASRIVLEVTRVRVERLQDISEADALAEGLSPAPGGWWTGAEGTAAELPKTAYALLWQSINGPGSWAANPWVWVVDFQPVKP